MRLNILIGAKAGQGINKISEIVSNVLVKCGYYLFNYRDYQSLIRGGHNFNIISISDKQIGSYESILDGIIALDENTLEIHKKELKPNGFIITSAGFENLKLNLNVALAGALIKILGISEDYLLAEIKNEFNNEDSILAVKKGLNSQQQKFNLEKLNNQITKMTGTQGIVIGAINSDMAMYIAYPMTPATGVLHELAAKQAEYNIKIFQPENEITAANAALGASFAGAKTMTGTSGGGFDLMTEALSFQGQAEIPLVIYLCSRPGPGTGIPTYTSQADLNVALYAGHGEFPRVVVAPGDPTECAEKTNEAFYLAEKFGTVVIVLSDKHLAESEFTFTKKTNDSLAIEINRKLPGAAIVKASSYEHDADGNTTESAELAIKNADARIAKTDAIKNEIEKFDAIKIHGKKESKNLIISWGSTKTTILDAIEDLDCKFMQVIYLNPFSEKIASEIQSADKIILIETNSTSQLGDLIRKETGIKLENKILRYDGKPFTSNELKQQIEVKLK